MSSLGGTLTIRSTEIPHILLKNIDHNNPRDLLEVAWDFVASPPSLGELVLCMRDSREFPTLMLMAFRAKPARATLFSITAEEEFRATAVPLAVMTLLGSKKFKGWCMTSILPHYLTPKYVGEVLKEHGVNHILFPPYIYTSEISGRSNVFSISAYARVGDKYAIRQTEFRHLPDSGRFQSLSDDVLDVQLGELITNLI